LSNETSGLTPGKTLPNKYSSLFCKPNHNENTDIAIYCSVDNSWLIIPSSTGTFYGMGWGGNSSDIPVTTNIASY